MSHDIPHRFAGHFARLCAVLVCAVLSHLQVAHAGTALVPANPAYQRFVAEMGPNAAMMYYGVGGKVLPSASGLAQYASVAGLSPTAGEISRYAALQTKYGQVPFRVSQTITAARLAKGVAAVAGGPLGIGLLALSATADWLGDAGVSFDASGAPQAVTEPRGYSDAYEYRWSSAGTQWYHDWETPCNQRIASIDASDTTSTLSGVQSFSLSGTTGYCTYTRTATSTGQTYQNSTTITARAQTSSPPPLTPAPVSVAAVETLLASKARTAAEIEQLLSELAQYPEVTPDPADITRIDPASPGQPIKSTSTKSTSTTTNPDGSKTTQTKTCEIKGTVKATNTLALSEVCVTDTVTTSPSGDVTGTSTTSTESDDPDAAAPQEEDDFCSSLVGKLVCADMDTPDDEVPKRDETVSYEQEDLGFGSGQCPPPYTWSDSAGSHEIDLTPYCDKLESVVKPLVILLAMLSALFIVAPGKTEDG